MLKDALLNQFNYNNLQDCTQVNNTKMIQGLAIGWGLFKRTRLFSEFLF